MHTPGPWRLLPEEADKPYIRVRGTRLGSRYKIANVISPGAHPSELAETRDNARLLVAAPELLDALIQLLGTVLDGGDRETIPAAELHYYQQLTLSVSYGAAEGGAA